MYFNNAWLKTAINENNLNKVQVKDKSLSTILTIGIPVVILGVIAYALRDGIAVGVGGIGY